MESEASRLAKRIDPKDQPSKIVPTIDLTYAAEELRRLDAENQRLRDALLTVVQIAKETHAHWDADRDSKVGKMLLALSGWNIGYDARLDQIHSELGYPL